MKNVTVKLLEEEAGHQEYGNNNSRGRHDGGV